MTNQILVTRVGFRLQVRPDLIDEYRSHHTAVWPEMLEALRRCGWHNYSLFLDDDGTLFGYFETTGTLLDAVTAMQKQPVNERWQALMGPYFVTGDASADQQMRELDEVFHLA
jgi:L-rhamnose mutarotase